MEAKTPATDPIAIPLNDEALARQTHLQLLKDGIADLQTRLSNIIRTKASRARQQSADVVKTGAKWADDSAHRQLGAYPWAKLAGQSASARHIASVTTMEEAQATAQAANARCEHSGEDDSEYDGDGILTHSTGHALNYFELEAILAVTVVRESLITRAF